MYWNEVLDKLSLKAIKYPLTEISGIKITKSEIDTITNIKNRVLERLAFTLLCLAKFWDAKKTDNNGWVNLDSKDVFKYARISCRADDREIKIGKLRQMGLLEFPKKNGNLNCRVTFINNDGDEELFISDFRELGYEYLIYRGENFIRCLECGILIRQNKSGTKKYCKNCATYTPQETKKITCIDCGKEFEVDSKNNKSCRCNECYTAYRRNYYKESKRKQRNGI